MKGGILSLIGFLILIAIAINVFFYLKTLPQKQSQIKITPNYETICYELPFSLNKLYPNSVYKEFVGIVPFKKINTKYDKYTGNFYIFLSFTNNLPKPIINSLYYIKSKVLRIYVPVLSNDKTIKEINEQFNNILEDINKLKEYIDQNTLIDDIKIYSKVIKIKKAKNLTKIFRNVFCYMIDEEIYFSIPFFYFIYFKDLNLIHNVANNFYDNIVSQMNLLPKQVFSLSLLDINNNYFNQFIKYDSLLDSDGNLVLRINFKTFSNNKYILLNFTIFNISFVYPSEIINFNVDPYKDKTEINNIVLNVSQVGIREKMFTLYPKKSIISTIKEIVLGRVNIDNYFINIPLTINLDKLYNQLKEKEFIILGVVIRGKMVVSFNPSNNYCLCSKF